MQQLSHPAHTRCAAVAGQVDSAHSPQSREKRASAVVAHLAVAGHCGQVDSAQSREKRVL